MKVVIILCLLIFLTWSVCQASSHGKLVTFRNFKDGNRNDLKSDGLKSLRRALKAPVTELDVKLIWNTRRDNEPTLTKIVVVDHHVTKTYHLSNPEDSKIFKAMGFATEPSSFRRNTNKKFTSKRARKIPKKGRKGSGGKKATSKRAFQIRGKKTIRKSSKKVIWSQPVTQEIERLFLCKQLSDYPGLRRSAMGGYRPFDRATPTQNIMFCRPAKLTNS